MVLWWLLDTPLGALLIPVDKPAGPTPSQGLLLLLAAAILSLGNHGGDSIGVVVCDTRNWCIPGRHATHALVMWQCVW